MEIRCKDLYIQLQRFVALISENILLLRKFRMGLGQRMVYIICMKVCSVGLC